MAMQRKWRLWLGVTMLAVLPGVGWLLLHLARSEPVRAYDRIQLGMTLPEVQRAIGRSADHSSIPLMPLSTGPFGTYLRKTGLPLENVHAPDQVVTVEHWTWDDYWIWVAFDEDGKAVGYYLMLMGDSFSDRMRRALGL
jgi:hypothetical protein